MSSPSRRQFLHTSALAGTGFWVAGTAAANLTPRSPNERLRIAGIGVDEIDDLIAVDNLLRAHRLWIFVVTPLT